MLHSGQFRLWYRHVRPDVVLNKFFWANQIYAGKAQWKCDMWCMRWPRHFEFSFCVCASDLLYFCPKFLSLDPNKRPQWKVDANTCRHFFKNDTWACNLFLARCCSDSRSPCTHSCITQLRVYIYFLFLKNNFWILNTFIRINLWNHLPVLVNRQQKKIIYIRLLGHYCMWNVMSKENLSIVLISQES